MVLQFPAARTRAKTKAQRRTTTKAEIEKQAKIVADLTMGGLVGTHPFNWLAYLSGTFEVPAELRAKATAFGVAFDRLYALHGGNPNGPPDDARFQLAVDAWNRAMGYEVRR